MSRSISKEKRTVTSQTFKFGKLWDWTAYSERTWWQKPLATNQPVNANWRGDKITSLLWWLHTNPSKIGWDPNFYNPGLFYKEPTESLKYKVAYISSPIYTNRLIFNLASRYFSSCSIMICQPISYSFKNLVSLTSSLLFSIVLIEELQSRAENGEETLWIFPRIWRSLLAAKLHRRKNNSASYAGYYYISLSI